MRAPVVAMVVGNDVSTDSRVRKTAASLSEAGFDVTVVGYSSSGRREELTVDGVRVVRVPVDLPPRGVGRGAPWWWRVAVGHRSESEAKDAQARLAARPAPWRQAAAVVRIARGLQRRLDRARRRRVVTRPPRAAWRWLVPAATAYESALAPELVALEPDLVHAHDVDVLAAAAAAVAASPRARGYVYDAHEFVAGLSLHARRDELDRAGWLLLEARFAPGALRLVTVSPDLATELDRRYHPEHPPVVVLNTPPATSRRPVGGVRAATGLAPGVPLLVYSGGVTAARGVHLAVESLSLMPGVHLAVVPVPADSPVVPELLELAGGLGVGDRLHIVAPVPPDAVADHLASADAGLIPLRRFPSHDVALTNKLFEYIHAGLPVVVSDCPAQAAFVRRTRIGEVHRADDAGSLAAAASAVLAAGPRYRAAVADPELVRRYSWQASAAALVALYRDLSGGPDRTERTS